MEVILANLLLAFCLLPLFINAYPYKSKWLEPLLLSFGLSVGLTTLIFFYLLLIFPGRMNPGAYLSVPLLLFLLSTIKSWENLRKLTLPTIDIDRKSPLLLVIGFLIAFFSGSVFLDGFFKPIFEWDTLARYAYWGGRIFELGRIDAVEIQYPLLLPITLAYSFSMSGGYNDYMAKIIPSLFSIATVLATYLLGHALFNKRIASIAAFLVISTATFIFWSTRVYVDIPQTFYTLMFLYSLFLYLQKSHFHYSLFAALFLGLSLWTKQSSAAIYITYLIFVGSLWLNHKWRFLTIKPQFTLKGLSLIVILPPLMIGAWYLRNYVLSGEVIWQAVKGGESNLFTLFPFISQPDLFGLFISPLFFVGILFSFFTLFNIDKRNVFTLNLKWVSILALLGVILNIILHLYKNTPLGLASRYQIVCSLILSLCLWLKGSMRISLSLNWQIFFLLFFTVPYYLLVWWGYSWENRFWVVLVPIFALFAAVMIETLVAKYVDYDIGELLLAGLFLLLFAPQGMNLIGHDAFHYGNVPDVFKKRIYVGDAYDPFIAVRDHHLPSDSVVLTHDGRIGAFTPSLRFANEQPLLLSEMKKYDYFFITPFTYYAYKTHASLDNEVLKNLDNPDFFRKEYSSEDGRYALYKVVK